MIVEKKSQRGFTLAELALALMIIGVLVASLLKGMEMVQNARVTDFIRQAKSFSEGQLSFQATYHALPGDINNPSQRLPDCASSPCNVSGNENNRVGVILTDPSTFNVSDTDEIRTYWLHLGKAGLVRTIDVSAPYTTGSDRWGKIFPRSPFGEGVMVHEYSINNGINKITGLYLSKEGDGLSPEVAHSIDEKMDDSSPYTGQVMVVDDPGCSDSATRTYKLSGGSDTCQVKVKL